MLLLLLFVCTFGWEIDLHPLDGTRSIRADLIGSAPVKSVVVCASLHPPTTTSHCTSRGFARIPSKAGRTAIVDVIDNFYYLIEYTDETGERFVKEIPTTHKKTTVVHETELVDDRPWYYYTVVIVAACVIGVVIIAVTASIWSGKSTPLSDAFVDVYRTRKQKNQLLAAQSLGLYQPLQ